MHSTAGLAGGAAGHRQHHLAPTAFEGHRRHPPATPLSLLVLPSVPKPGPVPLLRAEREQQWQPQTARPPRQGCPGSGSGPAAGKAQCRVHPGKPTECSAATAHAGTAAGICSARPAPARSIRPYKAQTPLGGPSIPRHPGASPHAATG